MSLVANQFPPNTEQLRDVLMSTASLFLIRYLVPSLGQHTNYFIEQWLCSFLLSDIQDFVFIRITETSFNKD